MNACMYETVCSVAWSNLKYSHSGIGFLKGGVTYMNFNNVATFQKDPTHLSLYEQILFPKLIIWPTWDYDMLM